MRIVSKAWVLPFLCGLGSAQAADLFSNQAPVQGVEFVHHAIPGDAMNYGAGAAWGDFDADGDMDLYVADQLGPNSLFMNLGGGAGFVDVAADYGVQDSEGWGTGALWGDYDNDGDTDLYVLNRGDNIMFRNDGPDGAGGWVLTDVTVEIGAGAFGRATAAVYGDYDNDGWLDLYVSNHSYPDDHGPEPGDPFRCDFLLHNVSGAGGERAFVNVAPDVFGVEVLENGIAHSAGFLDFDNDGDLDIYVVNELLGQLDPDLDCVIVWRNDGAGGAGGWLFTDVTATVVPAVCSNPMGLAIGDYNNDGWLDMAVSEFGPTHLLQNTAGVFTEMADQAGVARPFTEEGNPQFGWGIVFIDYDLDGHEDLFMATGRKSVNQPQPNPLFHNDGNPPDNTFTELIDISGCSDPGNSHTVIKADYDGDGDEDLYVVTYDGKALLCRNDQEGGDYLILELVGGVSNRDAIGARVQISAAGLPDQYRMVQSGSTTGGGHELALFFGVSGASVVSSVVVDWPSGIQTVLSNVAINQRLTVWEILPVPIDVVITGPTLVAAQETHSYTASVTYDNGVTEYATSEAAWSVIDGTSFASFTAPGQLTTLDISPSTSETIEIQAAFGTVQAAIEVDIVEVVVDTNPPSIVITGPTTESAMSTIGETVTLSGSVEDNVGVTSLIWSTDQGYSGPCAGLVSWTTGPIPLTEEVTRITITARDGLQNVSSTELLVTHVLPEEPSNPEPPEEVDESESPEEVDESESPEEVEIDDPDAADPSDAEPVNVDPLEDDSVEGDTDSPLPTDDASPEPQATQQAPAGLCGIVSMTQLWLLTLGLWAIRRHRQ